MSAQYVSIVLRACPGAFSEEFIRYYLPQERGWAYVHAHQLSLGIECTWPDGSGQDAQWWRRTRAKLTRTL